MRWPSERIRSIAASIQSLPCSAAISDRRWPTRGLFSGFWSPLIRTPAGVASVHRFSHSVFWTRTSSLILARMAGSSRFSKSFPSAEAHGGRQAVNPVPPAMYGYMSAPTSWPSARAASILATASGALYQLRRPAAFR